MALFSRSLKSESDAGFVVGGGTDAASSPRHTIGDLLRDTRKSYGGDIDRIATSLCIRRSYLTAIEESQYDTLPGPVYAQGFVRAYAVHLGLDGDEAIRRFKQEIAGLEISRDLSFPVPLAARSIPGGTMVLAALILALCGYGLWYYVSTSDRSHPERVSAVPPDLVAATKAPAFDVTPPAPATATAAPATARPGDLAPGANATTSPALIVTPSAKVAAGPAASPGASVSSPVAAPTPPTAMQAPLASASAATAAPPPTGAVTPTTTPQQRVYGSASDTPTRIVVHAVKDSWVQVRNGDEVLVQRTLHPGDSIRVPDESGLSLRTGNGAGIQLEIDGRLFKPLSGAIRTIALDPDRLAANNSSPPRSVDPNSSVPPRPTR